MSDLDGPLHGDAALRRNSDRPGGGDLGVSLGGRAGQHPVAADAHQRRHGGRRQPDARARLRDGDIRCRGQVSAPESVALGSPREACLHGLHIGKIGRQTHGHGRVDVLLESRDDLDPLGQAPRGDGACDLEPQPRVGGAVVEVAQQRREGDRTRVALGPADRFAGVAADQHGPTGEDPGVRVIEAVDGPVRLRIGTRPRLGGGRQNDGGVMEQRLDGVREHK